MTGVIDYGVGNLFSLMSSLKAVGEQAELSSDPSVLRACDRIILPGVGAFRAAMDKLKEKKLDAFVKDYAATGKSVMGICLGMQLLFDKSYEFGVTDGLGLIRGEGLPLEDARKDVKRFVPQKHEDKVPHMGWNSLNLVKTDNNGLGLKQGDFVYYVHSFYAPKGEYTVAYSDYGVPVTGVAAAGNVIGCQFHPEKSGNVGLKILKAFCTL